MSSDFYLRCEECKETLYCRNGWAETRTHYVMFLREHCGSNHTLKYDYGMPDDWYGENIEFEPTQEDLKYEQPKKIALDLYEDYTMNNVIKLKLPFFTYCFDKPKSLKGFIEFLTKK